MFIIPHKTSTVGVFADGKASEFVWSGRQINQVSDIVTNAKILYNHPFSEIYVIVTYDNRILYRKGKSEIRELTADVRAKFEAMGISTEAIDIKSVRIRLSLRGYRLVLYTETHLCVINIQMEEHPDITIDNLDLPLVNYLESPIFASDSPDPQKMGDLYVVKGRTENVKKWLMGLMGLIVQLADGTIYFTKDLEENSLLYRFDGPDGQPIIAKWFMDSLNTLFVHSEDGILYNFNCLYGVDTLQIQICIIDRDILSLQCDLDHRSDRHTNPFLFWVQKSDGYNLFSLTNSLKKNQVNIDVLGRESIASFVSGIDSSRDNLMHTMIVSDTGKVYSIANSNSDNPCLFKIDYFDDNPIFVYHERQRLKSARTNITHQ